MIELADFDFIVTLNWSVIFNSVVTSNFSWFPFRSFNEVAVYANANVSTILVFTLSIEMRAGRAAAKGDVQQPWA